MPKNDSTIAFKPCLTECETLYYDNEATVKSKKQDGMKESCIHLLLNILLVSQGGNF